MNSGICKNLNVSNFTTLYNQGFTLLELTIVLFILALILGGLLVPLSTQEEAKNRQETQEILKDIREGIYGYVLKNGYLPCPDTNLLSDDDYGKENRESGGACDDDYGNLPWKSLGVDSHDAWGNQITYRVDDDYADHDYNSEDDPSSCNVSYSPISFSLCSEGDIEVRDSVDQKIADKIPAIIVSHGKNFTLEDPSSDEEENLDGDSIFVERDFSQLKDDEFDDLLIWISPHVLRFKMVQAGLLP